MEDSELITQAIDGDLELTDENLWDLFSDIMN